MFFPTSFSPPSGMIFSLPFRICGGILIFFGSCCFFTDGFEILCPEDLKNPPRFFPDVPDG